MIHEKLADRFPRRSATAIKVALYLAESILNAMIMSYYIYYIYPMVMYAIYYYDCGVVSLVFS